MSKESSKEPRAKEEAPPRDDLLTPELANTELAPSNEPGTRVRTGSRATATAPRAEGRVGRFRIDAQLGSGGMGDAAPVPPLVAQRLDLLRARAPALSETVLRTIGRALEPLQGDRFPSMAPIIAALEEKTADSDAKPPSPPPDRPPPSRVRSWLVVPAIALAVLGGALALRARAHSTGIAGVFGGGASSATATCAIVSSHTLAVGPDDRLGVLPDGAVVIARDIRKGLVLQKETPQGLVPMPKNPMIDAIGHNYRDIVLRGVTYDGMPATLLELDQSDAGAFLSLFADKSMMSQRIFGTVNGLAATTLGSSVVVVATMPEIGYPRFGNLPNGVEAYELGHASGVHRTVIEEGGSSAPSVAALRDRVAVAYGFRGEMHFALLDVGLGRIGDVQTVARTTSTPAVAFATGDVPAVFWVDDAGGKTRLYGSAFVPDRSGKPAFSTPKMAVDEPLAPRAPITARLPDGSWMVAWIASTGGVSTLRASPIGAAGALIGPSDLATSGRIDALGMESTAKGIAVWWQESETAVRIAEVTCRVGR